MTRKLQLSTALAAASLTMISAAQGGPIEREELFRGELGTCPGTEVIVARLEIAPGATVPRHSHNGDEHLVVFRGGTMAMTDGKIVDFAAGKTFDFLRGVEHGGLTSNGDAPIVLYTVHVVDKDAPLNVAAK